MDCISWHTNCCGYLRKWNACVAVQACIGGLNSDKKPHRWWLSGVFDCLDPWYCAVWIYCYCFVFPPQTVQQDIVHSGVQAKADKSPVTVADYGTCWNLCLVLNHWCFWVASTNQFTPKAKAYEQNLSNSFMCGLPWVWNRSRLYFFSCKPWEIGLKLTGFWHALTNWLQKLKQLRGADTSPIIQHMAVLKSSLELVE